MHQSCFGFNNHVITRGLSIGTTLSIACGGEGAQSLVGLSVEGRQLQTCDRCVDETRVDFSAVIPA